MKERKKVERGEKTDDGWDKETLLEYWRHESLKDGNNPQNYVKSRFQNNRGEYIYNLIKKLNVDYTEPILELGPNAGPIFSYLYENGFNNLTGIEISPHAIGRMKEVFPKVFQSSNVIISSLEEALPKIKEKAFSVVYSFDVLDTIHPESNFVFDQIARVTEKYIIVIEPETFSTKRLFPRNYKTIFEKLGFKQISFKMTKNEIKNLAYEYSIRVFKKISKRK